MSKMTQDAKKDEFRKYLEKAGVLELLTKSLVQVSSVKFIAFLRFQVLDAAMAPFLTWVKFQSAGMSTVVATCLSQLYEEPEKPTDALGYLKNSVGGSQDDKTVIAQLRQENEQLKAKVNIRDTCSFFFLLLKCYCNSWDVTFSLFITRLS